MTAPTNATRRECQKTLGRLATVSRRLSSPALDVLWRYVDDFRHVLFPLDAYDRNIDVSSALLQTIVSAATA